MATTFVKVYDKHKIEELWQAGLLWRKTAKVEGISIPELRHVPCQSYSFWPQTPWADYGYLIED